MQIKRRKKAVMCTCSPYYGRHRKNCALTIQARKNRPKQKKHRIRKWLKGY